MKGYLFVFFLWEIECMPSIIIGMRFPEQGTCSVFIMHLKGQFDIAFYGFNSSYTSHRSSTVHKKLSSQNDYRANKSHNLWLR
jgi:hypothetical protein